MHKNVKREPGMCAIYGQCGKLSRFGSQLPCPANVPASKLPEDSAAKLEQLCGAEFANEVCCSSEQVNELVEQLQRVEPLIDSCPACQQNFVQLFCRFTCSPDQSQFIEVTETQKTLEGHEAVAELSYYVDPELAAAVYGSCADVKFSATNNRAMDLIGGGANEYKSFFKFIGDKKPQLGGSPFQINYPWDETPDDITRSNVTAYGCNDEGKYHCSCVDCPAACPVLPPVKSGDTCELAGLPCVSWMLLFGYLFCIAVSLGVWFKFRRAKLAAQHQATTEYARIIETDEDDSFDSGLDSISRYSDNNNANGSSFGGTNGSIYGGFGGSYQSLPRTYWLNSILQKNLTRVAFFCAKFPILVIVLFTLAAMTCSLGMFWVELLDEPAKLWVGPQSREAAEKAIFDNEFGMFYRTAQAFAVNETGPILQSFETMEWWFSVEQRVAAVQSVVTMDSLADFCLMPIGENCVVQSVPQYFHGDISKLNPANWKQQIKRCAESPVQCLPTFQQPIQPNLVFGHYNTSVLDTQALVTTWVLENDETSAYRSRVEDWELSVEDLFRELAVEAEQRGLRLSFNVESSLSRELKRSSTSSIGVVLLSYVIMFLYASLSLGGRLNFSKRSLVRLKFGLGIFGIAVVALSVCAAVGICAFFGVKLTLIITEVIPFMVLALGVDNIFLLVHQLEIINDLYSPHSIEERVSEAVGLIGPSIILSSTCEVAAIMIGTSIDMPAVHNFAVYCALAIAINTVLQLTMFVAALALDQRRMRAGRADFFPFRVLDSEDGGIENQNAILSSEDSSSVDSHHEIDHITAAAAGGGGSSELAGGATGGTNEADYTQNSRVVSLFFARDLAPMLLKRTTKLMVVSFFMLWLAASLTALPEMKLGLDQRLAVPRDSFLVDYFSDIYEHFQSGPPVYFVVEHSSVEKRPEQQALCGRFSSCMEDSLANVLEQERKRPELSYINSPTASWIDDFLQWLNPNLSTCCLEDEQGELCFRPGAGCNVCYSGRDYDFNMTGFPLGPDFDHYLSLWLEAPSTSCPLGGAAPYGNAISTEHGKVQWSQFRTSHVPLRSQSDYISAYANARRIANQVSQSLGLRVFPYSVFYVYFAQYSTIVRDAIVIVGSALLAVFVLSSVILGSISTAAIVTLIVTVMIVNIAGLMVAFGISLNALSLVNLVICVGIGVEFCVHVARAFTFVHKTTTLGMRGVGRTERAFNAISGTGGTVFGGIAVTKLLGVAVLAFASSHIFEVYYFRMWLALCICATTHALVLLPVLLTYWGGRAYTIGEDGLVDQFGDLDL